MRVSFLGAFALCSCFAASACSGGGGGASVPGNALTPPIAASVPTSMPSATPAVTLVASPTPSPTNTPTAAASVASLTGTYTALGDSITYGAGASSIFAPTTVTSPNASGTNFPTLVARSLAMNFQDLGISGARIGGLISSELPAVSPQASMVTIYVGTNDMWDAADTTNVPAAVANFSSAYATLVAGVKKAAPGAKIVLISLPDLSRMPFFKASPDHAWLARLHDASSRAEAAIASLGLPVISLVNDQYVYDPKNLEPAGLHPNDRGYAHIASLVESTMRSIR